MENDEMLDPKDTLETLHEVRDRRDRRSRGVKEERLTARKVWIPAWVNDLLLKETMHRRDVRPDQRYHSYSEAGIIRDALRIHVCGLLRRQSRMSLGQQIREARTLAGLSLRSVNGVSPSVLSAIERDLGNPSIDTLAAIARALDLVVAIDAEGATVYVRADERRWGAPKTRYQVGIKGQA
jgi:hypothetical protein